MAPPIEVVGSIDEGTQSTRFLLYDKQCRIVGSHQLEFTQLTPQAGWVEHDPMEILGAVRKTIEVVMKKAKRNVVVKALGITNQRETTVVWDVETGEPLHNAIVWLDSRTGDICHRLQKEYGSKDHFRAVTGLPISPYFSAFKMMWMIENSPKVRDAVAEGRARFGTVESWLIYNLTGGADGGIHVSDVTNASRTCLMSLKTCDWDAPTAQELGIPVAALPKVVSNSEVYGKVHSSWPLAGVPIAGSIGDQQAATLGQRCKPGEAKNTYGTGCFMLLNTGEDCMPSKLGLLTTPCWKLGKDVPTQYGLEGAIAIAGMGVSWLKNNLGLFGSTSEVEALAGSVDSTSDVFFVPAFGGLLAPYWDPDARGTIIGITQYTTKAHITRAMLEAICFQTRDVLEAMKADAAHLQLTALRVDGGASANSLLMQIQSDLLGLDVIRPPSVETTSLGAAFAAGLAVGFFSEYDIFERHPGGDTRFTPAHRGGDAMYARWKQAVGRSLGWIEGEGEGAAAASWKDGVSNLMCAGTAVSVAALALAFGAGVLLNRAARN